VWAVVPSTACCCLLGYAVNLESSSQADLVAAPALLPSRLHHQHTVCSWLPRALSDLKRDVTMCASPDPQQSLCMLPVVAVSVCIIWATSTWQLQDAPGVCCSPSASDCSTN
jgi:hypothetical protein